MPSSWRTIRSVFTEMIMFLTMVAVMGHFSVNFWERFVMHKELTEIKSSLNCLKETLFTIECAYENLQKDVMDINQETEILPAAQNLTNEHKSKLKIAYVVLPNVENSASTVPPAVKDFEESKKSSILQYKKIKDQKSVRYCDCMSNLCKSVSAISSTLDELTDVDKSVSAVPSTLDELNVDESVSAVPSTLDELTSTIYISDSKTNKMTSTSTITNDADTSATSGRKANTTLNIYVSSTPKCRIHTENASTLTRYPPKSVGVGRSELAYCKQNNMNNIKANCNREHNVCYHKNYMSDSCYPKF